MFTSTDLRVIYHSYFTLLRISSDSCEIKSNNTGHCWQIYISNDGYIGLLHKHHIEEPYHFQFAFPSVQDALLDIADHDFFQLNNRKPVPSDTIIPFWEHIVETYTLTHKIK